MQSLATPQELADHLNVPLSWVYSKTRKLGPGRIPCVRVGKYVRFRVNEVLAWLETPNDNGGNED